MNFCSRLISLLAILALFAGSAVGQTSRPITAEAPADQSIENQPLRASETDSKPAALRVTGAETQTSSTSDLIHVVLALALVIAIILALRAGVRKMSSLPGAGRSSKMVTVLSRSMISPRQQVLVLQVGKRLLVVGDSGGHMNALCELSDPDEIAALVGQTRQSNEETGDRKVGAFGNLFRRATENLEEVETPDEPETPEQTSVEEVGGLLDKIKLLQQQYKLKA